MFSQSQSERSTASLGPGEDLEHQENVGSTAGQCEQSWDLRGALYAVVLVAPEITRVIREEPQEQLSEADLEKIVDITLVETETMWLIDIPGIVVCSEDANAQEIAEKNSRYKEVDCITLISSNIEQISWALTTCFLLQLCKGRDGNDLYVERGMNTFNDAPKLKYVQTAKIGASVRRLSFANPKCS